MKDDLRKLTDLLEKQNKEWTAILLNMGKIMQESQSLLNFFYRDFVAFNTKPKWWKFWEWFK